MIEPPEDAYRPRPEVARIGGAQAARRWTVAVAAALLAVAGVSMANRAPTTPAVDPGVGPIRSANGRAIQTEVVQARATIGGVTYSATFAELEPNRLSATIRIPIPLGATSGRLSVDSMSGDEHSPEIASIGDWFLPLHELGPTTGEAQGLFVSYVSTRAGREDIAVRFRDSFSIEVVAENDLLFGILSIELRLGDAPITTASRPQVLMTAGPIASPDDVALMAVATLGERQFFAALQRSGPGLLTGTFDLPIPPPATRGSLELAQHAGHREWNFIAGWTLPLESLSAASGREYVVLDVLERGAASPQGDSGPLRDGYSVEVRAQSGVVSGRITVTIRLGLADD